MTERTKFWNVIDHIVTINNGKILKMGNDIIYIEKDDFGDIYILKEINERYDVHHFQLKEDQDKTPSILSF